MSDQSLMSIGRFAHLSGVTVHMLRHYDEVGILSPAVVDDTSLYRRYRPDQIRLARLIRVLRAADVPIEMIKEILEADAAGAEPMVRQLLQNHRDLLTLNRDHLTNRVNDVTRILERGLPMEAIRPGCHPVQIKIAVGDHGCSFRMIMNGWISLVARPSASWWTTSMSPIAKRLRPVPARSQPHTRPKGCHGAPGCAIRPETCSEWRNPRTVRVEGDQRLDTGPSDWSSFRLTS